MLRAIEHVTVTTGASRMSPRSEVDDGVLAEVRGRLAAGDVGQGLSVAIAQREAEGVLYDLVDAGRPIVRCWLCLDRAVADAMWGAAESYGRLVDARARVRRPKAAPWLAVALLPDALTSAPERIMDSGDLARIVAWALIEDRNE